MSGNYFLDTNIFVYSFDTINQVKKNIAEKLIDEAISSGKGVISFQVIQEFLNVATGRFEKSFTISDAQVYLEEILLPLCEIFPSNEFYRNVLEIKERTRYSWYDSMIVQAALESECRTLFSEDMQDGFKIYDLTIKNPFKQHL